LAAITPQRESLSGLFQRMRSDERMQVTWGVLAALSDADFFLFMEDVQLARSAAGGLRGLSGHIEERLREVREAEQAVRVLLRLCEKTPGLGFWDDISMAGAVPGLPEQLKAAHALLGEQKRKLNEQFQKTRQQLSRKSAKGRVEFIRTVARITKQDFGKPHYEIVAALANVVFNTGDDNSVSPEGVRAIVKRKPDYSTG
jgi:hypothetical protein